MENLFKADFSTISNLTKENGIYCVYLSENGLDTLNQKCDLVIHQPIIDDFSNIEIGTVKYKLIYIGKSRDCNNQGENEIVSGSLSELKLVLASLLCINLILPNTQEIVNKFLNEYCYFSLNDNGLIENLIKKYCPILNIQYNTNPNLVYKNKLILVINNSKKILDSWGCNVQQRIGDNLEVNGLKTSYDRVLKIINSMEINAREVRIKHLEAIRSLTISQKNLNSNNIYYNSREIQQIANWKAGPACAGTMRRFEENLRNNKFKTTIEHNQEGTMKFYLYFE